MWLCGLPFPGHEFVPARGGPVGGDLGDDVGDVGLGFDTVCLAGFDDAEDGGRAFAAGLRSGEEPVASSYGDTAKRALGDIVVDLVEEAYERWPEFEAVNCWWQRN